MGGGETNFLLHFLGLGKLITLTIFKTTYRKNIRRGDGNGTRRRGGRRRIADVGFHQGVSVSLNIAVTLLNR